MDDRPELIPELLFLGFEVEWQTTYWYYKIRKGNAVITICDNRSPIFNRRHALTRDEQLLPRPFNCSWHHVLEGTHPKTKEDLIAEVVKQLEKYRAEA